MGYSSVNLKSITVYLVICLIPLLLFCIPLLRAGRVGFALVLGVLPMLMIMLLIFKKVRISDGEIVFKTRKLVMSDGEFYFKIRKIVLNDKSITFKTPSSQKHMKLSMIRNVMVNIPILLPFILYCLMNFYFFLAHTYSSSISSFYRYIDIIGNVFIPLITVVLIINLLLITRGYIKKKEFSIINTSYIITLLSLCITAIIILLTYQPYYWFLLVDSFAEWTCQWFSWGPPRINPSITDIRIIILIMLSLIATLKIWRECRVNK